MIFFLKKFILKIKSTSSLKKITKEIVINENEFKISKKIANKKKATKMIQILNFPLKFDLLQI